MYNTHINHIDSQNLDHKVFLFEFTLQGGITAGSPKFGPSWSVIKYFLENYSEIIVIQPNLVLLLNLKNSKKILGELNRMKDELIIDMYSLISIEKGFIASTWLKKI